MLILSKKNLAAIRLPLGGDAFLTMRKATSLDFDPALAEATRIVAGLRESREALEAYGLPISFDDVDIDDDRLRGLFELIVNIELATRLVSTVENVVVEEQLSGPSPQLFAMLFLDIDIARRFREAALSEIYERTKMGNGFAPSPTGEGAAASPIAEPAAGAAIPALAADAALTASSAPNTNTAS